MKRGDYMKSVKITSNHFSVLEKMKLGEIIRIASQENTDIAKAEKFLNLIRS